MISVSDGQALLLCDNVLDMKPYHRYGGKITWEDSTRRAWLNGEFYESAFNKEEKNLIVLSEVVNEDHPDYGTDGGNNTKDHVVLLRSEEINRYMTDTNDLGAKASAYTIAKGIKVYASDADDWLSKSIRIDTYEGIASWRLRSPGVDSGKAGIWGGPLFDAIFGEPVENNNGICPALRINLGK